MKILILTFLILTSLQIQESRAFLGSSGTNISQSYPCIGLDGVPIPAGNLERQCCSNGQLIAGAPQVCRAGFNTISGDAAGGAAFNINLAQSTLNVAHDLNSSSTDINQLPGHTSHPQTAPNNHAEVSAVQGANEGGSNGMDVSGHLGNMNGHSSGNGSGSGSSGGSAGGLGGSGLGSGLGGSGSDSNGKEGKSGDKDSESGKVSGGFAQGNGKEGNGTSFGNHDMSFGSGDGANDADGSTEDIAFGDEEDATGSNGDVEGTIVDPSNYFALTNKSDDIFKIVSRRYTKKFKKLAQVRKGPIPASVPNGSAGNSRRNKPI